MAKGIPLSQTVAIETPLRQPRLPDRQPDRRPARVFAPPPQFPDYRPFWEGRQGSGPALPPLTGILRPQRDVTRLTPPASHGNFGTLSSFPFFVEEPTNPAPPKEFAVVPQSPLETTITPSYTAPSEKALQTPLALSLTSASSPLTLGSATAVRSEPPLETSIAPGYGSPSPASCRAPPLFRCPKRPGSAWPRT